MSSTSERPRRQAGLNASKAIAALANEDKRLERDGKKVASPSTSTTSAPTSVSANPSTTKRRRKGKAAVTDAPAVETDRPPVATPVFEVPKPQSLDDLPAEIHMQILGYLEDSPVAIYAMTLMNKGWNRLIMGKVRGKHGDAAWKRRCAAINVERKSPGCKTWRETYFARLRAKCLGCGRSTEAKFGCIWGDGPSWAVVCHTCQSRLPVFKVICNCQFAARGLQESEVGHLPFKYSKEHSRRWHHEYLYSSVLPILQEKARLENARIEAQIGRYNGDRDILRTALEMDMSFGGCTAFVPSKKLASFTKDFIKADEDCVQKAGEQLVAHLLDLEECKSLVEAELARIDIHSKDNIPCLQYIKLGTAVTWADAIVMPKYKDATVDAFIEAVRSVVETNKRWRLDPEGMRRQLQRERDERKVAVVLARSDPSLMKTLPSFQKNLLCAANSWCGRPANLYCSEVRCDCHHEYSYCPCGESKR